jgi:hypothetical protein
MMGEVFSEILCAQACDRSETCMRRILLDGYLYCKEIGHTLPPLAKMYLGNSKDCKYYLSREEYQG